MIVRHVVIQGGGIGGLIAATALAQRGVDVDVVEHRPAPSVLGVGLIQPANALRVMAEIGVLDECLAAGYQGDGSQVVGPDGTILAQATAPPPGDLPAAGNGIQRGSRAGSCSTRPSGQAPASSTAPPSSPSPTATTA
ncbi:MAG TPA: FAD-dependent monooxygenase [Streptosporangiaceae bacterium]|nr:FAD-dependent monooxygenase [Streptosporangiaceae bacterium]